MARLGAAATGAAREGAGCCGGRDGDAAGAAGATGGVGWVGGAGGHEGAAGVAQLLGVGSVGGSNGERSRESAPWAGRRPRPAGRRPGSGPPLRGRGGRGVRRSVGAAAAEIRSVQSCRAPAGAGPGSSADPTHSFECRLVRGCRKAGAGSPRLVAFCPARLGINCAQAGEIPRDSDVAVASSTSAGTSPRDTQFRRSAHTSIGGSTTSALKRATATFSATISPKSCNSGSDDVAITATPAIAVSADTMNARPVRDGGDVDRFARRRGRGAVPRRSATGSAT